MPEADSPHASAVATAATDEVLAYQALSTCAVLCFVLGLASLSAFGHWLLLWTLPLASVLMGVLALRQIASAPKEWAGKKLAVTGLGLAVLCFLGANGLNLYWTNWTRQHGRAVAERFMAKLKSGDIEAAFWLTIPQWQRQQADNLKLEDVPSELSQRYQMFREQGKPLANALSSGTSTIQFDAVERIGREYAQDVAAVVYKVHADHGDSHAMALAVSMPNAETGDIAWYVREYSFDYKPQSYQLKRPSGHVGHDH